MTILDLTEKIYLATLKPIRADLLAFGDGLEISSIWKNNTHFPSIFIIKIIL